MGMNGVVGAGFGRCRHSAQRLTRAERRRHNRRSKPAPAAPGATAAASLERRQDAGPEPAGRRRSQAGAPQ